jgi:hypothetical protein
MQEPLSVVLEHVANPRDVRRVESQSDDAHERPPA